MFDFLEHFLVDADHKAIYVLTLICVAMIIDFLSGSLAAKLNSEITFLSKVGINGILRKIASMVLENYQKMGIGTELFEDFIKTIKKEKDDEE